MSKKRAGLKGISCRLKIGGGRLWNNSVLLFLLPGLIGFSLFYIIPFGISLAYSFMSKPVNGVFTGISNYWDLLHNPSYIKGLTNTLWFIALCVPLNMAVSLAAAVFISKAGKYKELFILVFLIPLVIPSGATVFFWKMAFASNGFINGFLNYAGMQKVDWLGTSMARVAMAIIFIWKNMGYNMVLFAAGLSNIPKEYYEAAEVDGAGAWRKFTDITAVNLLPTLVLAAIMSIINSFKVFKEVYLIMGSYPHDSVYMLQHFMNNMFFALNYQKLTSATTVLVVIITAFAAFLLWFERRVGDGL